MTGGNQVGCWIFIVSREEGFFKVRKLFIVTFFFVFFLSHNWNRRLDAIQATRSGIDPLKLTFPWDLLQGFGGNTRGGRRRQRGSESSKSSALHGGWFFSLPQYEALFFRGEKPDTITGTFRRPPLSPPPVSFSRPLPPFTTCRYSLRSPRLFSIQSHRASSSLAYRSTMFNFLPFQTSSPFPIFLSASCNHLTRCLVWISFENAQHEFPSASSPLFFYSPRPFSSCISWPT